VLGIKYWQLANANNGRVDNKKQRTFRNCRFVSQSIWNAAERSVFVTFSSAIKTAKTRSSKKLGNSPSHGRIPPMPNA
jgi:hypothetical protein